MYVQTANLALPVNEPSNYDEATIDGVAAVSYVVPGVVAGSTHSIRFTRGFSWQL